MKILKFNYAAVVCFSIVLSSCGGGGGSSVVNTIDNTTPPSDDNGGSNDVETVLPFNLQDNTGLVAISARARSLAIGSWHGHLMHFAHAGTQVPYEGEQAGQNFIAIESFVDPKCKTGNILYSDNAPPVPVYLTTDLGEWPGLVRYNLQATNCKLVEGLLVNTEGVVEGSYTFGDYVNGSLVGESYISNDANSRTVRNEAEYTSFAFGEWDERGNVFNVTGSSSSSSITSNGETKVVLDVPREEYNQESTSQQLVLTNFHNEFEKAADGSSVTKQYGYTVKWNVKTNVYGHQVDYRMDSLVGVNPSDKAFPLGDFELTYAVTDPLVETDRNNALFWPYESGSVSINLASHHIRADITYHKDYALVIYNRNGSIEQVRINADLSSKAFLEER